MKAEEFADILQLNPMLKAVSDMDMLDEAIKAPGDFIFFLTGSILDLEEATQKCHESGAYVFLHLDLIKGFSRDVEALRYIKDIIKADGVISTKVSLLKNARAAGLIIVQRLFMLDSTSFEASMSSYNVLKPDAVEILPGVMPKIIKKASDRIKVPIISGGFIENKEEIIACLKGGASSISTSRASLWYK